MTFWTLKSTSKDSLYQFSPISPRGSMGFRTSFWPHMRHTIFYPHFYGGKKIGKFAKYPTSHHLPQKNYYADSVLGLLVCQTRKVTLTKKPCFACVQINSGLAHFFSQGDWTTEDIKKNTPNPNLRMLKLLPIIMFFGFINILLSTLRYFGV